MDGAAVTADDVLREARRNGDLDALLARARRGQAALADDAVPTAVQRRAEKAFRQARRLVAAEQMEAWLGQWDLTVAAWRRQLRRELVLEDRAAHELDLGEVLEPDEAWAAVVVSGLLQRATTTVARACAAAAASGRTGEDALAHVDAASATTVIEAFRAAAASEQDVDEELRSRALDWTRVRWAVLPAPHLDAAREARLCLLHDRTAVHEVARLLDVAAPAREAWLRELAPALRDVLLELEAGGASLPRPTEGDRFEVLTLLDRRRPSPDDRPTRGAVHDALADQALAHEVKNRIRWHVDL